ncbi:5'-nucleotidase domain-containing protein 3-like [Antedon mediterranea]|uniref:5'-nucleotidase domain-containing protein 3-like n=1 Tax=Antedon mediterranea TaxID=105859 RepID=UPI003AF6C326
MRRTFARHTHRFFSYRSYYLSNSWNKDSNATSGDLWRLYKLSKDYCEKLAKSDLHHINPKGVFSNNELNLGDINIYGFDYDYTLADYTVELDQLIYKMALQILMEKKLFPPGIKDVPYDPTFAIRGLHYDIHKGLLLKIDAFHRIQFGSVFKGHRQLSNEEVIEEYDSVHIPVTYMSSFHGKGQNMRQLMDIFSIPEMALLANVIEYLENHNIDYCPANLFDDIHNSVKQVHFAGEMHNEVMENPAKYLKNEHQVVKLLSRLHTAGKKLFLITNSHFHFVDRGMQYLCGHNWREMFDVVVTQARKPYFFNDTSRPFRCISTKLGIPAWSKVNNLEKGKIYLEGNIEKFVNSIHWNESGVLYFGDHVYSDLADPSLKHGWRTGAIIPELESEITTSNSVPFKQAVVWLLTLQALIEKNQVYENSECQAVLQEWLRERHQLRVITKTLFNRQFGSIFRTYHNPTYFSRRLSRFADIYTSSVDNLLSYSLQHSFYPQRAALPHEMNFNLHPHIEDETAQGPWSGIFE